MDRTHAIARVALSLPTDRTFDFAVPDRLAEMVVPGRRVRVPFRSKPAQGIVVALPTESDFVGEFEEILDVFEAPAFTEAGLAFVSRVADRCLAPLGLMLNRMLPRRATVRRQRRVLLTRSLAETSSAVEELRRRAPLQAAILESLLRQDGPIDERRLREDLGKRQLRAPIGRLLERGWIRELSDDASFPSPVLTPCLWAADVLARARIRPVHLCGEDRREGIAQLVEATLAGPRCAIVLTPGIPLAERLRDALAERLGFPIDLYHSGLSEGERGTVWERARCGGSRIVVGTRSALFIPLRDPGLVVVDEEQDRAYKQEDMLPYYHVRDVATALMEDVAIVFGSAAPSLEVFYASRQGRMERVPVGARMRGPAPVRVIAPPKGGASLAPALCEAIRAATADVGRVLLAVTRQGYYRGILCRTCGRSLRCPGCSANLVYRTKGATLVCRLCGRVLTELACPECGGVSLRFVGVGAERVEQAVRELVPNAVVARIGGTEGADDPSRDLERLYEEGADVVIGTPMVSLGPSVRRLRLAAAIDVDAILSSSDFRAAERAYQFVDGLSRRLEEGEMIVQSRYPDHYALRAVVSQTPEGFYAQELEARRELRYPPFAHLARLVYAAGRSPETRDARVGEALRPLAVVVLGPVAHPWRRGHRMVLLKGDRRDLVRDACVAVRAKLPNVEIDLDPSRV